MDHVLRVRGRKVWNSSAAGLRTGPCTAGSQCGAGPNSQVAVLPSVTSPARAWRRASSWVRSETVSRAQRDPSLKGVPDVGFEEEADALAVLSLELRRARPAGPDQIGL